MELYGVSKVVLANVGGYIWTWGLELGPSAVHTCLDAQCSKKALLC
jgi:hypothetical protein